VARGGALVGSFWVEMKAVIKESNIVAAKGTREIGLRGGGE